MPQFFRKLFIPIRENNFVALILQEKALLLYVCVAIFFQLTFVIFKISFPQSQLFAYLSSQEITVLINKERQKNNLAFLETNTQLNEAAQLKAQDMIANDYFAHVSPSGVTPWSWLATVGYNYEVAGENLAIDFFDAQALVQAWLASPAHRDNILNSSFSEVGVAVTNGEYEGRQTNFCVLMLGDREAQVATVPPKEPAESTQTVPVAETTSAPVENIKIVQEQTQEKITELISAIEEKIGLKPTGEKLVLVEVDKTKNVEPIAPSQASTKSVLEPRVLGIFASRADEIISQFYVFFSTFVLMALLLNVLIRINIQHWPTIVLTILLLILNLGMIYL